MNRDIPVSMLKAPLPGSASHLLLLQHRGSVAMADPVRHVVRLRNKTLKKICIIAGTSLAAQAPLGGTAQADYAFGYSSTYSAYLLLTYIDSTTGQRESADKGWWGREFGHNNLNKHYVTGNNGFNHYNNFFSFDLAGISPLIVQSASVRINGAQTQGVFDFKLSDVSTPYATLSETTGAGPLAEQVYDDLYTGRSYGTFGLSPADDLEWREFTLNANGVEDINRAVSEGGYFSIGGSVNAPPSSDIDNSQTSFLASNLGVSVNQAFAGGTLQMDQPNALYALNFTVDQSTANTIDQSGNQSVFTGVFSDAAPGHPGNLTIVNTGQGGRIIFTGANTYSGLTTISTGATLAINGSLAGPVQVNSGAMLQGNGAFGGGVINNGGVLAPGNSIGTLVVNGNMTFAPGSIYAVEVDAAGASDRTIVNGAAIIQGGDVSVWGPVPSPSALPRTRYTILTATNGVSGRFDSLNMGLGYSFLTPTLAYGANDVTLGFALTPFSVAARNINQRNVGNALTRAALGPVSALGAPILDALYLGNYDNARSIMDTVGGAGLAGVQTTAMQVGGMVSSAVSDQIAFWRSGETTDATGVASHEGGRDFLAYAPIEEDLAARSPISIKGGSDMARADAPRTVRAWGSFFGGGANYLSDAGRGAPAANLGYYGGVVGVDYQIQPDLLVGAMLGGSTANFGAGALSTNGNLTGFHAGLYGAYKFGSSYVALNETFSVYDNQTSRQAGGHSLTPYEQLEARFGSTEFRTRLEAGHSLPMGGLTATPFVAAEIAAYQSAAFIEHNNLATISTFALRNDGQLTHSLPTFIGLRLSNSYTLANGWRLTPTGSVAYVHEFFPQRQFANLLVSLPGTDFTVSGPRSTHNLVQTKIGAQLNMTNEIALFTDFQGEFSSVSQSYGGKAGLKVFW